MAYPRLRREERDRVCGSIRRQARLDDNAGLALPSKRSKCTRARVLVPHKTTPGFSHLVSGFAQHYGYLQLLLASEDSYFHAIAGAVLVHDPGEILLALYFVSVNGDDQIAADHDGNVPVGGAFVAAAQSRAIGSASGDGLHDEESIVSGEAEVRGEFGIDGES